MEERIINRLCVIIFANAAFTLIGCYVVYLFLKDIENTLHEKIQDLSDTLKQMQWEYLQPIITQYFIDNKSEIWLLFLIAHSKR